MKKTVFCFLFAAFLLVASGCSHQDALYLYVLPRSAVSADMSDADIAAHALKSGRLALEGSDLTGVQWDTQRYEIREDTPVGSGSAETGGSALLKTTDADLFVWVLNGRAVYAGGFAPGSSSAATPRVPFIRDENRRIFRIETDDRYGKDRRFDRRLYGFFERQGLLRTELSE